MTVRMKYTFIIEVDGTEPDLFDLVHDALCPDQSEEGGDCKMVSAACHPDFDTVFHSTTDLDEAMALATERANALKPAYRHRVRLLEATDLVVAHDANTPEYDGLCQACINGAECHGH